MESRGVSGSSGAQKTMLTLNEVKALQSAKSSRVSSRPNTIAKSSSTVWNDFRVLFVDDVRQDLVQCQICQAILRHTAGHEGSGTSGMRHHLLNHQKKAAAASAEAASGGRQQSLASMLTKTVPEGQINSTKKKLAHAIAVACACDMRPLSMCEGKMFSLLRSACDVTRAATFTPTGGCRLCGGAKNGSALLEKDRLIL